MAITIIHLSDIHFRKSGNPVSEMAAQIARAAYSTNVSPEAILVIISGDVAFSGEAEEYKHALGFFTSFQQSLREIDQSVKVLYLAVPGNHDCYLPEKNTKVRESLIGGFLASLNSSGFDRGLTEELLKAQSEYEGFRKALCIGEGGDGLCEAVSITVGSKNIQVNLYNTALLSQRNEKQGALALPVAHFVEHILLAQQAVLSLSVFHHSYIWLESNSSIEFRNHIERTSDIAFCGHQHYSHDYYKQNSTGERVLYYEAPALQDENYSKTSAFRVLVVDLDQQKEKSVQFRRSRDLYRMVDEVDWRPITINRAIRREFRPTKKFEESLNATGHPFYHDVKGQLTLKDIFVYPELRVTKGGSKNEKKEVRGDEITDFVMLAKRVIFQGGTLSGKTTLGKVICSDALRKGVHAPIFLSGARIGNALGENLEKLIWRVFEEQYGRDMLDEFQQLPSQERLLIIDDWHRIKLNAEGREECIAQLGKYFGSIALFVDELFQLHELLERSPKTLIEFDRISLGQFGHKLRGQIIDKWVKLGREFTGEEKQITAEIESKERLVDSVMGKNTLPRYPFIVLFLLQAEQEKKAESAEAGSFGYLYEVLVTTALSQTTGPKAQLEKKYKLLSLVAYEMLKKQEWTMSLATVRKIAADYSKSHLVTVDIDSILSDLEQTLVLTNLDGNYSFAYSHLFYYFAARYYRDNLDREPELKKEIEHIADNIASNLNSSIALFIIYFARDSSEIVKRLVSNADRIYADELAATLEEDIQFLNQLCKHPDLDIPEDVNVDENRKKKRELDDRNEQDIDNMSPKERQASAYSDAMSDVSKFDLAYMHIGLLGQVIRNFPGSLPGPEKLMILKATYRLGLRMLGALLRMLEQAIGEFRKLLADALIEKDKRIEYEKVKDVVSFLVVSTSRLAAVDIISKIAYDIGVADLESAYSQTLEEIGRNAATELIDLAIKLNNLTEFPLNEIKQLHKEFAKSPFPDTVLADICVGRLSLISVERTIRQSVASLFKLSPATTLLVEQNISK
jgi:hypothetical protein